MVWGGGGGMRWLAADAKEALRDERLPVGVI